MSKTIEEIATNLIESATDHVGTDDMVEIVNSYALDFDSGESCVGALLDEEAFGTSWKQICKDYKGEEDWIPNFKEEDVATMGKGGYIKLAIPIKWCMATGRSNKDNPLCFDTIGVLPPVFRPVVKDPDTEYMFHPLNYTYSSIVKTNNRIRTMLEHNAPDTMLNNEIRMLNENIRKLFFLVDYITAHATDGAKLAVYKVRQVTNVCNDIEEIREEVRTRLDKHDALLQDGKHEEARRMALDAHSIMFKAHLHGVDIATLKDELIRAIGDIHALNEILGIDTDVDVDENDESFDTLL